MKKLQIDEEKAKNLYKTASPEFKEMLIDTFGKEFFCTKITDRIKTFKDACIMLGINTCDIFNSSDTKDEINYKKLKIIIKALNEGWEPNWSNPNEMKWRPWFNLSSFGFAGSTYHCGNSDSFVGSRLCFKSEELCDYCCKQFVDIWEGFLK